MAGIVTTMLAGWLLLFIAPETPVARWLHARFVVAPAVRIDRLTRGHGALVAILVIVIGTVAWLGEGDAVRMLAMAAPDAVAWLATAEIAAWLDVAMATIVAWTTMRLRLSSVPMILRGPGRSRRSVRRAPLRRPDPANDDGDVDRRRCA